MLPSSCEDFEQRVVEKNGFEDGDLGSHSCHKGVVIMVAAGSTVSPSIVSLCIRAGLIPGGGMKDKYLSKAFPVSPAYFDYSDFDAEKGTHWKKIFVFFR